MISAQAALNRLIDGNELFYDEMADLMRQIMSGELTSAQIAAILIGLRVKVETVSEIAAAASVMREFATPVPVNDKFHLVDTCGTGGDHSKTFNISTTCAFVAAAAGARVAKHGGRASSSASGSADVLEALGVNINLNAEQVAQSVEQIGLGFMFAPNYHGAMKHVAPVRKELGVRTIFNILGPLTNPAGAENQLLGVFHADLVGIMARVLKQLGSRHVLVVHGCDGLDEITLSGETQVAELKNGEIREYTLRPSQFGLTETDLDAVKAYDADQSAAMLLSVLENEASAARDIVLLNAGAGIYVSGVAHSLETGIERARDALSSGAALTKLRQLIEFSQQVS